MPKLNTSKIINSLGIILVLVPPVLCLSYIALYGVNVAFWDEWELVLLIGKLKEGSLAFYDFWRAHNEHRAFFAKLVYIYIGNLTYFNSKIIMFISFLFLCIAFACVCIFIKNSITERKKQYVCAFFCGVLMFNWVQYENLLWAFQIGFFMTYTFSLFSIFFAYKYLKGNKKSDYAIAIALALVASFSHTQGLLVWVVVALGFINHYRKSFFKRADVLVWAALGLGSWLLYFAGTDRALQGQDASYALEHPVLLIKYMLELIGRPLSSNNNIIYVIALVVSAVILYILISAIRKYDFEKDFFPLSIMLFGLFSDAIMAVGRISPGGGGRVSRYTTFTLAIYIGIVLYLFEHFTDVNFLKGKKQIKSAYAIKSNKKQTEAPIATSVKTNAAGRIMLGVILLFIVCSIPFAYLQGARIGSATKVAREYGVVAVNNYKTAADENLKRVYPNASAVRDRSEILEKYGYNAFREDVAKLEEKYFYKISEDKILYKAPQTAWTSSGKFELDGGYPGVMGNLPYEEAEYIFASWCGGDGNTGLLKSEEISIPQDGATFIACIYQAPSADGISFGIDVNNDGSPDISYDFKGEASNWNIWQVDLSKYAGSEITIIAEDNGKDFGQWFGFAQPVLVSK